MKIKGGRQAVEANDPSGMLKAVLALPRHLREGHERGRSTSRHPEGTSLSSVVFCGMGGSGVAGDVVRALYRDRLVVPFDVVKGSLLPEFCGKDSLVICSSYSGNTEETLACYEEAAERGCRLLAVTSGGELAARSADSGMGVVSVPGGFQPRAALGYLAGATLGAMEGIGLIPSVGDDVREAATVLEELAAELGPERDNAAVSLAAELVGLVPVMWGADGIGSVAASRWKTQLNENAKVPAFSSSLPELDHNEVVGWSEGAGESFFLVALRHEDEEPGVARRFGPSIDIAKSAGMAHREVWAAGQSPLARLLSLVMMGDATSVYLAFLRGVDPTPIEAIHQLKQVLAAGEASS